MAVTNRALDTSEQKKDLTANFGALGTGASALANFIPWPCTVNAVQMAAFGLSGAPTVALVVNRFIIGSGFTAITIGAAQAVPSFGTSGVLGVTSQAGVISGGFSLTVGSSLLTLLANDVVMLQIAGTSSNVLGLATCMVVTPIQDVRAHLAGLA